MIGHNKYTKAISVSLKKPVLGQISKKFKKILLSQFNIVIFNKGNVQMFMIEVHILLNMFLNVISCEIILPMYFEIPGFERHSLRPILDSSI